MGDDPRYPVGVVHGDQSVTLARPIPTAGTVDYARKVIGVYDKGSGAHVIVETRATLADSGEYLGSANMGLFCIGKGGFGGPRTPPGELPWVKPDRAADIVVSLPVGLNQSLIYRLLGDKNPHGTDPERARADGFDRPVFYGLGSFGVACRAVLRGLCDSDAAGLGHFFGRFSSSVHPGDRLDTHIWRTGDGALFQTLANGERLVLDRGVFRPRAS
jgi:acyl dehydratase